MASTNNQQHSPIALNYARALLDLARQKDMHERIGQELSALSQAIQSDETLRQFFRLPSITHDERIGVLKRALGKGFYPLVLNFLGVLNEHGRLGMFDQVAAAYQSLLDELLGNVHVHLTVAHELSKEQLKQVAKRVGEALNKKPVIHQHVDDSIIGGLVLKVEDKLIDASVRSQLQAMKQKLLATRPK